MKENHEAENVAVPEKSAEVGGVAHAVVCASSQLDGQASTPSDDQVIHAIMDKFNLSFGDACDAILLAAEHMRIAA
jgi:hypothetical protein